MNNLINKITSAVSGAVLFAAACVMAGLGFAVLGTLAVFALFAVGIALLAAPFVALAQKSDADVEDAEVVA